MLFRERIHCGQRQVEMQRVPTTVRKRPGILLQIVDVGPSGDHGIADDRTSDSDAVKSGDPPKEWPSERCAGLSPTGAVRWGNWLGLP